MMYTLNIKISVVKYVPVWIRLWWVAFMQRRGKKPLTSAILASFQTRRFADSVGRSFSPTAISTWHTGARGTLQRGSVGCRVVTWPASCPTRSRSLWTVSCDEVFEASLFWHRGQSRVAFFRLHLLFLKLLKCLLNMKPLFHQYSQEIVLKGS